MTLESKTLDVLTVVTGLVVLTYLGVWIWALVDGEATFAQFFKEVGQTTALLLGYWVRGIKQ